MDAQFVGRKVKIELQDGSVYDGFVHSYNTGIGKLSLEKVVCHENGERKKLIGLQHFFADEIDDNVPGYSIIKLRSKYHNLREYYFVAEEEVLRNKSKGQVAEQKANIRHGSGIMRSKCEPTHLKRLNFLEPAKLVLKTQKQSDGLTSSGNDSADDSESEGENQSYPGCTILPKINPLFYEAITHIKSHQVIGLAMEGVSIGREGRLCWIQIAVADHVFLFDMLGLGPDSFDEGIASILEDGDILKVLHNCRMVADMLHHQFNINLVNVFDTQVANVFIYRLWHHNDWPRYVDGLAACLVQHLDLSMEEVNWAVVREKYRESDEEVWLERPVRKKLIEALVKNVKHLLSLRQVLMEKMMAEFVAGVNIYLSHVKDASKSDARKYQKEPYLLPLAFQDIRHFMVSYTGRVRQNDRIHNISKDQFGFIENCSGIKQPHVNFSRDSLWHAGSSGNFKKSNKADGSSDNEVKYARYANTIADIISESEAKQADVLVKPVVKPQTGTSVGSVNTTYVTENKNNQSSPISNLSNMVDTVKLSSIQSVNQSQSGNQSQSENQPQSRNQSSEQEELKGTSLMRVLIQEQAPEGGEDHSDVDLLKMLPAGKLLDKLKSPKSKSNLAARNMNLPDLSKYKPTGFPKKTLTQQERRMVAHMKKNVEDDELWDDEDSIISPTQSTRQHSVSSVNRDVQQSLQSSISPQRQSVNSGSRFDTSSSEQHRSPQSVPNTPVHNSLEETSPSAQRNSTSRLQNILALMNKQYGKNGDIS